MTSFEKWRKRTMGTRLQSLGGGRFLRQLVAHRLGKSTTYLHIHPDVSIREVEGQLEHDLNAIEAGIPPAYLFGEADFLDWTFISDKRALAPREETAYLVDFIRQNIQPPNRIIDLGAGSGVIGISLALYFPDSEVVLAEVDTESRQLCQENIDRHKLSTRVQVVASDWWQSIQGSFDLVVANPPYVDLEGPVEEGVRLFEPTQALFCDDGGMQDLKTICLGLTRHLNSGGSAYFECGYNHRHTLAPWLEEKIGKANWFADPFGIARFFKLKKEDLHGTY